MDMIEVVAVIYEISIAYVIGAFLTEEHIHQKSTEQDKIVADIAHSLQTPLTVARAELELLSEDIGERESIGTVRQSLVRISEFIHRILQLARLEGCVAPPHEVLDFSILVHDHVEYLSVMADEYRVRITSEIAPHIAIEGDRRALTEVVTNIAHNAMKYRRSDVPSTLHVVLRDCGSVAELSCTDNGIGIAPKDIPRIFDRLYRVRTDGEGCGLGLAFVKAVVLLHKGTIGVTSVVGEGTTFTIRLPQCKMPPCGDNIQKGMTQVLS